MHKLLVVAVLLGGAGVASADPNAVTLSLGDPTIGGALDAKAVAKVVKRSTKKLHRCFDKQGILPVAQLEVTARFTIAVTGKVVATAVEGLDDQPATKCMTAVIAKLTFAKPRDGKPVEVSYPLLFDPPMTGAFASLTGTGDISSGFDDTNIYGGLLGNEAGELSGGGGTGWGTIGTGTVGTIGHGSGTGNGYGVGAGRAAPNVAIPQPTVTGPGDLDKAIIRRYVKRNINKLRYCYEKELLATPTLHGTVTTAFTIDELGVVGSVKASGMKSPPVESCVATVIKGIEFPKPKGGAIDVTYPFTFKLPTTK